MSQEEQKNPDYSKRLKEVVRDMAEVRDKLSVRADAHLKGLGKLVREIFMAVGFDSEDVLVKAEKEEGNSRGRGKSKTQILPGYFRVTKNWDLLVIRQNLLVAAVEFKSMNTSAGKNVNNRVEEVLGSGTDLWAAHDANYVGLVKPWLGYFMILEDSDEITSPVRVDKANFDTDRAFNGKSYVERYQIACERMVDKGLYDAACLVVSKQDPEDPLYEPSERLGINQFAAAVERRAEQIDELRRQLGLEDVEEDQLF